MRDALSSDQTVLAIDPGLSGAVALVGRGALRIERDFKELQDIAVAVNQLMSEEPHHVVIELVGARPGQGVVSMFNFGKSTGTAYGAMFASPKFVSVEEVHPLKWQNYFKKTFADKYWGEWNEEEEKMKFDSRKLACCILPQHLSLFHRKKDHNSADAALIGLWKLAQLN